MGLNSEITGVILADGKNKRFGTEKSFIIIENEPLISKNVNLFSEIFKNLILVTSKPALMKMYNNVKVVEDLYKNCGPLGGIHAALSNLETDFAFIVACDMPYLDKDVILKQVQLFFRAEYDVFVPSHPQGIEPLHAIYAISSLQAISNQLKNNICSIRYFYNQVKTGYFQVSPDQTKCFFNINTMHDYQIAKQMSGT
jgi:molybdopterin-guanine dinucleotide biosynthesis protein A